MSVLEGTGNGSVNEVGVRRKEDGGMIVGAFWSSGFCVFNYSKLE